MKVVFKVLLFGLASVAVMAVMAMFGMPGARDGDEHIVGDYYFTHSGGYQNSISEERGGLSGFVIHMKVEEFVVQGNGIFVTRRPVVPGEGAGNGGLNHRLSDTCEYYRINVTERKVYGPFALAEVKNRAEWAFLKKRRFGQGFGATMCKLEAVWE
ncbi:MAG: hypothetical protein V4633_11495 [Pseudomonadota bacterium]